MAKFNYCRKPLGQTVAKKSDLGADQDYKENSTFIFKPPSSLRSLSLSTSLILSSHLYDFKYCNHLILFLLSFLYPVMKVSFV